LKTIPNKEYIFNKNGPIEAKKQLCADVKNNNIIWFIDYMTFDVKKELYEYTIIYVCYFNY